MCCHLKTFGLYAIQLGLRSLAPPRTPAPTAMSIYKPSFIAVTNYNSLEVIFTRALVSQGKMGDYSLPIKCIATQESGNSFQEIPLNYRKPLWVPLRRETIMYEDLQ